VVRAEIGPDAWIVGELWARRPAPGLQSGLVRRQPMNYAAAWAILGWVGRPRQVAWLSAALPALPEAPLPAPGIRPLPRQG